ncbi:MAG: GerMN domain-containing protein [Terriglobales bacterium]
MIPRHLLIAIGVLLLAVLAMGFYAGRMRGRASQVPAAVADTQPVAPPVSGPTERVTLYVAYDDPGILRAQGADIPLPSARQQRAEELLRALLGIYLSKNSPHPIAPGAEVRAVYLVTPGLAIVDLNSAFASGHRSGVLEEELTVTSVIQTLAANIPGILRVKILVDGKERETLAGHADLSDFYDTGAVAQAVALLQGGQ